MQQEHEQQRKTDCQSLDSKSAEQVASLVKNFPSIWNDPCIPSIERKQMVAYLIEDVTIVKSDNILLHIRFKGGKTQTLSVEPPVPIAKIRKTLPEVVELLDILLENCTDLEASIELNKKGFKNWKAEPVTYKKVQTIRIAYKLKSSFERLRSRGFLTADEVAVKLGMAATTVHVLGREGLIPRQHYANNKRCLYDLPDNFTYVKGHGGLGATKAKFITSQSIL